MDIKIEITFTPATDSSPVSQLRLRMIEPGRAEPTLTGLVGEDADKLFAALYSEIQSARIKGHLQSG